MNLDNIRHFLLDMDGTIYLGDELLPDAASFLQRLKDTGRDFIFLTNNSSKNRMNYVAKLKSMGIDAAPDDVFTSGEATVLYINKIKPAAKVYLLGTPSLCEEFNEAGFELTSNMPDFVILGFDTTLTYEKLHRACDLLRDGVPFIATHPDFNCPLPSGRFMPDTGAMIRFFEAATGVSPIVIGKPNRGIADALIEKYGFVRENTAMVGDRLYTDIAIGKNAGIKSILVFSGETSKEEYENQHDFTADAAFDSVAGITALLR